MVLTVNEIVDNIEFLAPLGKSDHAVLNITCSLQGRESESSDRLNYNKGDYDKIRENLDIDWDELFKSATGDVEIMWELFHSKLDSVLYCIPKVANFSSWKKNKWQRPINKNIRENIKIKSKLWKKFIATKDPSVYAQYRQISNIVRKQTRSVYKQEQNEVARISKENPKKFWNYVNSRRKSRSIISDLISQDELGTVFKADTDEKKPWFCHNSSRVFTVLNHQENLINYQTDNVNFQWIQ